MQALRLFADRIPCKAIGLWLTAMSAMVLAEPALAQNVTAPPEVKLLDVASVSQPSAFFEGSTHQLSIGGQDGLQSTIIGYSEMGGLYPSTSDLISGYYPGHILLTNNDGGLRYRTTGYQVTGGSVLQYDYTFRFGGVSERFAANADSSIGVSVSQNGGLISYLGGSLYSYTDRNGVIYTMDKSLFQDNLLPISWPIVNIVYPNGRRIYFQYQMPPAGSNATRRLIGVQDNRGWFIKYEYLEDTPSSNTSVNWSWIYSTKAGNKSIDNCTLAAQHCSLSKGRVATNSWTLPSDLRIGNATGGYDEFTLDQFYQVTAYQKSTSTTPDATYTYCSRQATGACSWTSASSGSYYVFGWSSGQTYKYIGKVLNATVHGVYRQYQPSMSCVCSGFAVATNFPGDHFGSAELGSRSTPPSYNINDYSENVLTYYKFDDGRMVNYTVDPTNRIAQYQNFDGIHNYTYDARGNITQEVINPIGGGTARVLSAVYPASCTNYVTCNKPSSMTDANGNVTQFSYDPTHGGILTKTSPADINGLVAQTRYQYTQRSAVYYNDSGALAADPYPIWLLARESFCKSSNWNGSACSAGASDEVVTTYDYGPTTGANNLLLRSVAVTADGTTQRTCYGYNAFGDRISETRPNAQLTSCP